VSRTKGTDFTVGLEEGEEMYNTAAERALARLEEQGLNTPQRPYDKNGDPFDGHLPSNITDFTSKELGTIFALMCGYADFLENLATVARAEVLNADRKLKLTKSLVRKQKAGSAQTKDDECLTDIRYVEADVNYVEAKTYLELLEGLTKSASRDRAVISRLIETKRMEVDGKKRRRNVDGYRRS
jgi:hypothetical protein